ncbi:response regulator [Halobaculum sp. D14]|uniref:response regulator n=1 Tax=Halobaculum sp. D14 TaxID=3421642 RepID=UPI003EB76095
MPASDTDGVDDRDSEEPPRSPESSVRLLYVESDDEFAALVATYLGRYRPRVTVDRVRTPEAAMAALRDDGDSDNGDVGDDGGDDADGGVDCVVTDHRPPALDGVALCRRVHRVDESLPVLLLTGEPTGSVDEPAAQAGASAVLYKRAGLDTLDRLADRVVDAAAADSDAAPVTGEQVTGDDATVGRRDSDERGDSGGADAGAVDPTHVTEADSDAAPGSE